MSSEALEAARALIPSWVVWVSVLWPPLATFVVSSSLAYFCARIALFRATGITSSLWTERARATYPARRAISLTLGLSVGFMVTFLRERQNPLLELSFAARVPLCLAAAILGIAVANYAIAPRLGDPPFPWRRWFRSLATSWLVSPGWLILLAILAAMPDDIGIRAVIVTVVGLAAFAYPAVFGTLPLLYRLGLAAPASARLAAAAAEASQKIGVTPAAICEIDILTANAFALLIPRQVAFSHRAVEILDHQQLVAVCCHEFAHVAEPGKIKLITLASYLALFPIVFSGLVFDRFDWTGLIYLGLLIAIILRRLRAVRRRMEGSADAAASHHELDAGVYAAALERMYSYSKIPAVLPRPGIHGHLYDRMVAAGVTPSYQRPAPPSRSGEYATIVVGLTVVFLFATAFDQLSTNLEADRHPTETAIMWHIAIGAADPSALAQLADLRSKAGHIDQAVVFYEAAVELDGIFEYRAKLAIALSALGRCDDAVEEYTEIEGILKECRCGGPAERSAERAAASAIGRCSASHT